MTEPTEIFDEDDNLFLEVFPYPKWIRLFNYFFPKTEGYKNINWRKYLKTWSRWAPWLTIFLLISIIIFSTAHAETGLGIFSGVLFIVCFFRFLYLLVLSIVAKCLRRSPITALSLMPLPPLCALFVLGVVTLFCAIFVDNSNSNGYIESRKEKEAARHRKTQVESVIDEAKPEPSSFQKALPQQETETIRNYEYVVL